MMLMHANEVSNQEQGNVFEKMKSVPSIAGARVGINNQQGALWAEVLLC